MMGTTTRMGVVVRRRWKRWSLCGVERKDEEEEKWHLR